jgi:hypothetical protein
MKTTHTLLFATAILLAAFTADSFAQSENTPAQPSGPPNTTGAPPHPDAERGTTGWSGASKQPMPGDQTALDSSGDPADPGAAINQPWMATGIDLKGPPVRFPANKTPE